MHEYAHIYTCIYLYIYVYIYIYNYMHTYVYTRGNHHGHLASLLRQVRLGDLSLMRPVADTVPGGGEAGAGRGRWWDPWGLSSSFPFLGS